MQESLDSKIDQYVDRVNTSLEYTNFTTSQCYRASN